VVVQRVVGNVVLPQVTPHVVVRPPRERRELGEAVDVVGCFGHDVGAIGRLLTAQPGQPCALAGERARQRLDLARGATRAARVGAAPEAIDAVARDQGLDGARLGEMNDDVDLVAVANAVDQCLRLLRQAPGVEREDADVEPVARDEVDQHHVLGAEARCERRRSMLLGDPVQQRSRRRDAVVQRVHDHRSLRCAMQRKHDTEATS